MSRGTSWIRGQSGDRRATYFPHYNNTPKAYYNGVPEFVLLYRQLGIDKLITVGGEATPAAEAFRRDALCFADQAALQSDFPALPAEYTIWVKGSRRAGLEHTVAWLLNSGGAAAC